MNDEPNRDQFIADPEENPLARGVAVTALLAAGALYYLYRRSRQGQTLVAPAASSEGEGAGALVRRGQYVLETTLDHLSDQAMSEVKVMVKNGLHRLEQMVDDL